MAAGLVTSITAPLGWQKRQDTVLRKPAAGLDSPDLPRCERWRDVGIWLRFNLVLPWERLLRKKERKALDPSFQQIWGKQRNEAEKARRQRF